MASVTISSHIKQTAQSLSLNTCSATVTVSEKANSVSVSNNTSWVTVSYSAKITSNRSYTGNSRDKAGYLRIIVDGTSKDFAMPLNGGMSYGSVICSGSYDQKISHNNDGTYTVNFSGQIIEGVDPIISPGVGGYDIVWVTSNQATNTVTTTTIPRGSTITTFNKFTIEDGLSFKYKDNLASKTLTLKCILGNTELVTKTYTSAVGEHEDSITFDSTQLGTIYNLLTQSGTSVKSANFKLTLSTSSISGTSSKEAEGTLKAAANKPTISGVTIEEVDLTSYGVANNIIIRYISGKVITASATPLHGATITSVRVQNGSVSATMNYDSSSSNYVSSKMTNLTAGKFTITATDSRGFSSQYELNCTLREYNYPTVTNVTIARTSETQTSGSVQAAGSYWNVPITSSSSLQLPSLNISIMVGAVPFSITYNPSSTSSNWNVEQLLPDGTLMRDQTYVCTVTATDQFDQTSRPYVVTLGIARRAAWMGRYTFKAEGFVGDHYIGGEINCSKYLNVFPVGAIYMSVTNTNPSEYFGGTWVQIAQGRAIVGVGSLENNTVQTWGSVTAGDFNPAVNERGGSYTHKHYMHGTDADGPRTAIGAVDSDVNSIGYVISSPSAWGPSSTKMYALNVPSIKPKEEDHTFNHYTPVYGYTRGQTTVEPYLAVYVWQRTA